MKKENKEATDFPIYLVSASTVFLILSLIGLAELGYWYYGLISFFAFIHTFLGSLIYETKSSNNPCFYFSFFFVPTFNCAYRTPVFALISAGLMAASVFFALKNRFLLKQAWKERFTKQLNGIFEEYCQFQTEPVVKYINNILDTAKQKLPAAKFKHFLETVNVEAWCMGKVIEYILDSVSTGEFHIWRGALDLEGEAMARAYHQIVEKMREKKYISEEEYEIANDNIHQAISSV